MSIGDWTEGDLARFIEARLERTALGYVLVVQQTAPADAALQNGIAALWVDPTPGAAKLMVKAKNSSGTVVTAAVALT